MDFGTTSGMIKDLLPSREGSVGVTAADNRLFVEAVLYRYRAGIPWRDLPERFGDCMSCPRFFWTPICPTGGRYGEVQYEQDQTR